MKKILLTVGVALFVILLVGVYKFNFINDDIYIKNQEGKYRLIDETKNTGNNQIDSTEEFKNKTGKIILITEIHPIGKSISSVVITTKGFKENKLIRLDDIDPIEKIELKDLDNNALGKYIYLHDLLDLEAQEIFMLIPQPTMKG